MKYRNLGRVFVTGACGFIGSHLVEKLLNEGNQVTALCLYNSNGTYGWLNKLAVNPPNNLSLLLGDVRDPFFLENSISGHNTVFHLASLIAIPYSYVAPQSYIETNISGALNVAQAALKAKAERLIHTSTSEVYGTAKFIPITEDHPLQGQSPYSASKIGADMLMDSYFRSFTLPIVTLRPFNTYGPRQSLRAVIPTIISQVMAGQNQIKLGSDSPTRDFNYVADTVDAFLSLARHSSDSILGKTFNAGTGNEITIKDLVHLIAEIMGKKIEIITEQERLRPEKSEVFRLCASHEKLTEATGWTPKVTLKEGLSKLIEWVRLENHYSDQGTRYTI